MSQLMRCEYCGALQDEPTGAKVCVRCSGDLVFVPALPPDQQGYLSVQMELDQIMAPSGQNVERHLLVTVTTPKEVPASETAQTDNGRAAMGFSAVLDVSGSMTGGKIEQAKEGVKQALHRLQEGDAFSLVTFGSEVRCVFEPNDVNDHTRKVVNSALQEIRAGGMTALCGGLEMGLARIQQKGRDTKLLLLLSDGQANVGETDIEKVGYRALEGRQKGVITSTLGVGSDYNEALMAEIANQGGGRFYHVSHPHEIGVYLNGELGEAANLGARDVKIHLNLPANASLMPLSSAYIAQQNGQTVTVSLGDIPCDTELEIPLRLTLPSQNAGTKISVEGAVSYRSPAGNSFQTPLNRVTIRFTDSNSFELRDGVVAPVAERVYSQLKAAKVLNVSRASHTSFDLGQSEAAMSMHLLQDYAVMALDADEAAAEMEELPDMFDALQSSPAVAKQFVSDAHAKQRSSKKFKK